MSSPRSRCSLALGGAGFAASLALVKAPQPITLVAGGVGTNGKVTGAGVSGGRQSKGVFVITIRGDMFAPSARTKHLRQVASAHLVYDVSGAPSAPPTCAFGSNDFAANGSATATIDCFEFDRAAGWQPADAAFDFQIVGPSR